MSEGPGLAPRIPWPNFERWFREQWEPGEHVVMIGPTSCGKTYLASRIVPMRNYVVAFDSKGYGDPSMRRFGFKRVKRWPLPWLWESKRLSRDEPIRVVFAPDLKTPEQLVEMRRDFYVALQSIFMQGGWSVYVDELQLMTDFRTNAGRRTGILLDDIIRVKRFTGTSVIASTQAPRYVPKSTLDQPTHVFLWRQRDRQTVMRMAEIGGADRAETMAELASLDPHEALYIGPTGDMYRTKVGSR